MNDVGLAHHLADVATATAAPYLHHRPTAVAKSDGSPVTEADLAIDAALLRELAVHRPADEVLSEESGHHPARGGPARGSRPVGDVRAAGRRCWVLDPLDGTEAFVAGRHAWGTHIALQVDENTVLGVITRPTQRRHWWAVRGHGAWTAPEVVATENADEGADQSLLRRGRRPLLVSSEQELAEARVGGFVAEASALAQAVSRHARWASDPLSPVLALAEGRLEAVVATGGQVWDHAPQVLLVTEAGGSFRDPRGGQRPDRGGGLYSNGRIDTTALVAAAWPT